MTPTQRQEALTTLANLRAWMPVSEYRAINTYLRGPEAQSYAERLAALWQIIHAMPVTYGQDGLGQAAIAYLHYFRGGWDVYLTERDVANALTETQEQAFGLTCAPDSDPKLGYIHVGELCGAGLELDLHFTPKKTLREIKAAQ